MMTTGKQHRTSFKALVDANRAAGRLDEPAPPAEKDASQRMQNTGMRLTPDEYEQAKQLAAADDRAMAWFCRRMYLRGLEAFLAEQGKH